MITPKLSDYDLWDAILNDDRKAFALLFDRYWLRLFNTAKHYLKDEEACESIVHDVFLVIWNKRQTLKIESFQRYLNAATRYEVLRYLKAAKSSPLDYVEDYPATTYGVTYNQGNVNLQEEELRQELEQQLQKLPVRCREIFCMSRLQRLSNEEISKELNISKHTVENQLANALKILRANLDIKYISLLIFILTQ